LSAIEYWEHKQSKAILGGELDGKTNSEARIMINDKVRREILLHDVLQIEPTVNRHLVAPIVLLNGMFPQDRMPVFRYDTAEPVDQKAMIALLKDCVSMGMEVDSSWAHQALQIPRAAKGATLLTAPGASGTTPAANAALVRLAALANAAKGNSQIDIASAYGSQLAALCVPHEEALIQQIAAIVAEAGSFDQAISAMEALTVNNSAWADSVALGLAAANLAGRSDAN
jgi:phage gp29-like protein